MPLKPITPVEAERLRDKDIPEEVIDSVNELIAKKWDGNSATIKQKDIVRLSMKKLGIDPTREIFDFRFLNFEKLYEEVGWTVFYDKPGYNESYDAYFVFQKGV
jgi:hypothetical protein